MPPFKSQKRQLLDPKTGKTVTVPKLIHPSVSGCTFGVKLCVGGRQEFIGHYDSLDMAVCERDRALHLLAPWLRSKPTGLIPLGDLRGLQPNARLEGLLSKMRSIASEAQAEGMAATDLTEGPLRKERALLEALLEQSKLANELLTQLLTHLKT